MPSTNFSPGRENFHVTIIGGGITGLAAAWNLQQAAAQEASPPLTVTLLEKSARLGGKIRSEHVQCGADGASFVVEGGPDSFITQKPWALQLARDLGMEDRLLPTNDDRRNTFVLNRGRPTPMPEGMVLIAPTKFLPFVRSPLISPWGKLRMALDLAIPPRRGEGDETLAAFIGRRLGREALDKIAEPLLSGIYNAEAEKQSLLATFPRFREMEKEHGSLIRGMLAARRSGAGQSQRQGDAARPPSVFVSFQDGMQELVAELGKRLQGSYRLGVGVNAIRPLDGESRGRYELALDNGSRLQTDAIILAVPAFVAARLLQSLAPEAAQQLAAIRYVSTGTISLGYRAAEVDHPLDGFGVVIPRSEKRDINAITWTSTKFDCRAPEGFVLIRAFFGGSRTPHMTDKPDDALVAAVRRELSSIMGIDAAPLFHRIFRYPDANPQYDVGHLTRVAAIEAALPPGIFVSGSPYRGIGIPDCVHQAQQTAQQLRQYLQDEAV